MDIKPIRTEEDYLATMAQIENLLGAPDNTEEGDLLDILLVLVEKYENDNYPVMPPHPVAAIEFRMDQMGLNRKDLEPILGHRGRVSEVLNGKRALSLNMIKSLHKKLNIPFESLIQDDDDAAVA